MNYIDYEIDDMDWASDQVRKRKQVKRRKLYADIAWGVLAFILSAELLYEVFMWGQLHALASVGLL